MYCVALGANVHLGPDENRLAANENCNWPGPLWVQGQRAHKGLWRGDFFIEWAESNSNLKKFKDDTRTPSYPPPPRGARPFPEMVSYGKSGSQKVAEKWMFGI